ncbi:MAG: cation diffusion facilitator family transporter [Eubacterium sp.]
MRGVGIKATCIGIFVNLMLFFVKLYIGISANSLAVYCDAVNNLGDTLACAVALAGFLALKRLDEKRANRLQSLCTFVIELVITFTGGYFVYNGLERLLYPLPVTYSKKYAVLIAVTVLVKALMAVMYKVFNKKADSAVLKAMILDSVLDCFITLFALMSLILVVKVNYAVDGVFAIITGSAITVTAIRELISQVKYLIND